MFILQKYVCIRAVCIHKARLGEMVASMIVHVMMLNMENTLAQTCMNDNNYTLIT